MDKGRRGKDEERNETGMKGIYCVFRVRETGNEGKRKERKKIKLGNGIEKWTNWVGGK